jgi:DNA end-binding protein Ku
MRNSWRGSVSVGLLSIGVSLGSLVTEGNSPALHQYAPDGGRIRIRRVSEKSGKEVSWGDIWTGYQSADGTVIAVDDADLEEAYGPVSRDAQIKMFTDAASVPAVARRSPYVIQPAKGGERAYALLARTLRDTGKVAIVEFGIRQRKRLAEISADDDGYLLLSQLEWSDDIKKPDFTAPVAGFSEQELSTAKAMVDAYSATFVHADMKDDSTAKLDALIQSRLDGTAKPKSEDVAAQRTGAALDLLAVIQASVEAKREEAKPKPAETPAKPKTTRIRKPATPKAVVTSAPKATTPAKVTPVKVTPVKVTPAKVTPVKRAPAKAVPANPTQPRRRTTAKAAA